MSLPDPMRAELLRIARAAIRHGLGHRSAPCAPDVRALPPELREHRASFVTLDIRQILRGCMGALEPHQPLAADVCANAFRAAFEDPRFPPLKSGEEPQVRIHISILSPREPVRAESRDDLLRRLRPGEDGLVVEDGPRRATFLPSVWQQLPCPREFLEHLLRKARLPADHWSPTLRVERYTTESFGE